MKPVKAWAVLTVRNGLYPSTVMRNFPIFYSRRLASDWAREFMDESRIVRVVIREVRGK